MTVNVQVPTRLEYIPRGSTWKYLDDGSDPGNGWTGLSFVESGWKSGKAPLGYGNGNETTTVGYGSDASKKYVTTYFRHSFECANAQQASDLLFEVVRDDGAVVYLNGQEVLRSNMATGPVNSGTLAPGNASDDGRTDQTFTIASSHLRTGRNVVAVEIHQSSRKSSDIRFDLRLSGKRSQPLGTARVRYDRVSRGGVSSSYVWQASGAPRTIPGLTDRVIYQIELTGLVPGASYHFVTGNSEIGYSTERSFRTLSATSGNLRVVVGGDMGTGEPTRRLLDQAAAQEPHFAVIGGDIAYADGVLRNVSRWDAWFENWCQRMITPKGYTIPAVLAIGNHEVRGSYGKTPTQAPFFFGFFAQSGTQSYFVRTYGPDLALFVLDTGHVTSHGGAQTTWLDRELGKHSNRRYRMAAYHVPLYPGHRSYNGSYSALGRKHWAPLFDRHQLTVALENHDHVLKRTHPILGGKVHPSGTVYLGDGCWGRSARSVENPLRWYLAHAEPKRHIWVLDIASQSLVARAIDMSGNEVDRWNK
jgi:hypothetical protein